MKFNPMRWHSYLKEDADKEGISRVEHGIGAKVSRRDMNGGPGASLRKIFVSRFFKKQGNGYFGSHTLMFILF